MKQYISNLFRTLGNASVLIALTALMACNDNETDAPDNPSGDSNVISWNVEAINNSSRAFVNNNTLKTNCTPNGTPDSPGDVSERVGIIGDLVYKHDNSNVEYFSDVRLGYYEKPNGRKGVHWNYAGADKFWVNGTYMPLRAFYPAKYLEQTQMLEQTSNAQSLRVNYSTMTDQIDMLLGYRNIDSDNYDRSKAIDITMRHAMAGLKFQFKLTENNLSSTNKLTACWLESDGETDDQTRFATVGLLVYGLPDMEKVVLSDSIMWKKSYFPPQGYQFYKWENPAGTEFTKTKAGIPYLGGAAGNIYTDNEGFVLIIPQYIPKNLYLCFTTEEGGQNNVTRVPIPVDRGGSEVRDITSSITDPSQDGYYIMEDGHRKQFYLPNFRYIYNILIDQSGVILTVDIAPWNNFDSNTSIDF